MLLSRVLCLLCNIISITHKLFLLLSHTHTIYAGVRYVLLKMYKNGNIKFLISFAFLVLSFVLLLIVSIFLCYIFFISKKLYIDKNVCLSSHSYNAHVKMFLCMFWWQFIAKHTSLLICFFLFPFYVVFFSPKCGFNSNKDVFYFYFAHHANTYYFF